MQCTAIHGSVTSLFLPFGSIRSMNTRFTIFKNSLIISVLGNLPSLNFKSYLI